MGLHWHGNDVGLASTGIAITLSLHPRSGARLLGGVMQGARKNGVGVLPLKLRANRYELALSCSFLCGQAQGKVEEDEEDG